MKTFIRRWNRRRVINCGLVVIAKAVVIIIITTTIIVVLRRRHHEDDRHDVMSAVRRISSILRMKIAI